MRIASTARQTLEDAAREIRERMASRDRIAVEKMPDLLEEAWAASQRDIAAREINKDAKTLQHIEAALERIHRGTYGLCVECGGRIPAARMAALPWAALCRECQEVAEAADC